MLTIMIYRGIGVVNISKIVYNRFGKFGKNYQGGEREKLAAR